MLEETAPIVTPNVVFIDQLLEDIANGILLVPKFQRPFVWTPKQMTFLFDSVRMGYPIGSLLLWETDEVIESLGTIGGQHLQSKQTRRTRYVLDGHQRLSTLFGVMRRDSNTDADWLWKISYDIRDRVFLHVEDRERQPAQLPMNAILRTMDFIRECRRIELEATGDSTELIEEAERVAQRFKGYRLPINVIAGDLDQAVETFARLNTTGRNVSVDQMVSALTYREGEFHLESRIDEIMESLTACGFGTISRRMIFRTIVAAMGLDVYKTDWKRVSVNAFPELPNLVDGCESGLLEAAAFLQRLGVPSAKTLPYEPAMMMLAEFFRRCENPSVSQLRTLESWFWKTSYTGWFTGASDTNINECLSRFKAFSEGKRVDDVLKMRSETAVPFPEGFNTRNARVRTLFLFLLTLKPRNLETGLEFDQNEVVRRDGNLGVGNVVTGVKSTPGNKLVVGIQSARHMADLLRQLDGHSDKHSVLVSHAVSEDAWLAIRNSDHESFISLRTEHLVSLENQFIESKGVKLADQSSTLMNYDSDD